MLKFSDNLIHSTLASVNAERSSFLKDQNINFFEFLNQLLDALSIFNLLHGLVINAP